MTTGKRIWLCIMAVVLVLAAVGIVTDIVFDGISFRVVGSIAVWFMVVGWWLSDFRQGRSKAKQTREDQEIVE